MAVTDERLDPSKEPDGQQGQMTLFEHLAELRPRLLICIVAVVVGTIVAWFFYNGIIRFMEHPYRTYVLHHPHKAFRRRILAPW